MRIAVAYNEPKPGSPDSEDVLDHVKLVERGAMALGFEYRIFTVQNNGLEMEVMRSVKEYGPDVVFNLVEEQWGGGRHIALPAAVYELMGLRYTGAPYSALYLDGNKTLGRTLLQAEGVPIPACTFYRGGNLPTAGVVFPALLKPAFEHGSVGIDDSSFCRGYDDLRQALPRLYAMVEGQPILIEQYIDGREFNVSLLGREDGGVDVLPIPEMLFENWPSGKPRIVNYQAKWDGSAFEYNHTPRRFNSPDTPIERIQEAALGCWRAFGLRGYARVDMRVDASNEVYVIDVNANPCLSPDAGFMAACQEAGIGETEAVSRIIRTARHARDMQDRADVRGQG